MTKSYYTSFPAGGAGKSPLCLLCRVVSKIPLQRLAANLLWTCWGHVELYLDSLPCR